MIEFQGFCYVSGEGLRQILFFQTSLIMMRAASSSSTSKTYENRRVSSDSTRHCIKSGQLLRFGILLNCQD